MSIFDKWRSIPIGKTSIWDRDNDTELKISTSGGALVSDYNLEVLKGNVAGHAMVPILGHTETLTTTKITVASALTTTDIDQSGIHATPAKVKVASSSTDDDAGGTGLLTLLLIGLDADGVAQTETIVMDGQTEVESVKLYSAINGFRGLSAGGGGSNAGTIYVGVGTFTLGVPTTFYFTGEINTNKGTTAYYTVPAGKTLYTRTFVATMTSSNKEAEMHTEISTDGIFWVQETEFGIESGGFEQIIVFTAPGIVAGSHLKLTAKAVAMDTELTALIGAELVDN